MKRRVHFTELYVYIYIVRSNQILSLVDLSFQINIDLTTLIEIERRRLLVDTLTLRFKNYR